MRCKIPKEEMPTLTPLIKKGRVEVYEGILPNKEFEELFLRSDVFVLPMQNYALIVLEAMSFGLPVITSDTIIKDNGNGFWVKPPKYKEYAPLIPFYHFEKSPKLELRSGNLNLA